MLGSRRNAVEKGARGAVLAALVALAAGAALAPADAEARTYRSPGYAGTTRIPRTLPPAPPRALELAASGERPQVTVDAAGTAHVVWNEPGGGGPDVLRYCRLLRGGGGCSNPASSQRLIPEQPYGEGSGPELNRDVGVPRVLALNDQLALLTNRYPIVVPSPDGGTSDSNTYLFASDDGGTTFGPPALVGTGQTSGQAVVYGSPDSPRIGLVSDTQTGGAFFQSIAPGVFTRQTVNLGDGGYGSTLAAVGGTLALAYNSADFQTTVRSLASGADPNDPGAWSATSFPGEAPVLAAGPSGVFAIAREVSGRRETFVRKIAGTTVGAAVKLPQSAGAALSDLTQDPAGLLAATYRVASGGDVELLQRVSSDGRDWSAPRILARAPAATGIWDADASATADGGGFAVLQEGGSGQPGRILAVPFGTGAATRQLGLGALAGGAADPSIVQTCQRISFADVDVVSGGCMLSAAGRPGVKVSEGLLRLNGLEIVPEGGTRILLNARERTIDTTGSVRVQLRAEGVDPIVLFRGRLNIDLRDESKDARALGGAGARGCTGKRLASFDAGGALLKGFPVAGSIDVFLQPDASCIPLALALPKAFGGIRGDAVLRADNTRGLVLDSLRIAVRRALIGPVLIEDLLIAYTASSDEWIGRAMLGLPPQPGGPGLGADVRFVGGDFAEGGLRLRFPFPGLSLDPFAVSYLSYVNGRFSIDPLKIGVGAGFGILPLAPPLYTFRVDGTLDVTFADPVRFVFRGTGSMFDFPIADQTIVVTTNGFASAAGNVRIDLGVARVTGGMDAFVDMPSERFSGSVFGEVCVLGVCPRSEAVVSTKGVGACVTVTAAEVEVDGGFGYHWGDPFQDADVMFGDCDLTDYRIDPPAGAAARAAEEPGGRAAQVSAGSPRASAGQRVLSVKVQGEGAPPSVTLVSPGGARIDPAAPGSGAVALPAPSTNATYVAVPRPAAGAWQVEASPGSAPIVSVASATPLPAPRVSARVGGSGRTRTLAYRATQGDGLATTFVEQWRGGEAVLGRARGARGTLRFAPAPGPRGPRAIVALVERDGMPRLRETVARYVAPGPPRPGRVSGLRVAHRGTAVVVSWRKAAGARLYAVRADLPRGRREVRILGARTRSLKLAGVGRRDRVRVSVTARDANGRAGAVARARG